MGKAGGFFPAQNSFSHFLVITLDSTLKALNPRGPYEVALQQPLPPSLPQGQDTHPSLAIHLQIISLSSIFEGVTKLAGCKPGTAEGHC